VPLAETIDAFEQILAGKHDDLPMQAFRMVGNIEEVKEQAARLTKAAGG
jgi:F-type H+-transporting ATPase subunit beta